MSNPVLAILTAATCGASCWYAKEEICRCSCDGKNHGCMLDPDNPQPERTAKIDGVMYRLETVGSYNLINNLAAKALSRLGWRRIDSKVTYGDGTPFHYQHYATDNGSAIRVNTASESQRKWPEVKLANIASHFKVYILWVQVDIPGPVWCSNPDCERCIDKRMGLWFEDDPPQPAKEIEWDFGED